MIVGHGINYCLIVMIDNNNVISCNRIYKATFLGVTLAAEIFQLGKM